MDLKQLPFSPKLPYRYEERRVSYHQALSDGPGQASATGHRVHGRQPAPPSSPQPGHRKVRQTVLGRATADGESRYGSELLLKAPERARKGPKNPKAFCL